MFNALEETKNIVEWLKNQYKLKNNIYNKNKFIITVSGGSESAIVAALCAKVIDKKNIILLNLPYGADFESGMANTLQQFLGAELIQHNCISIVHNISSVIREGKQIGSKGFNPIDQEKAVKDVRDAVLAIVARERNAIICNTTSFSKAYLEGISLLRPKQGEIFPVLNYTHNELIQIGMVLGVPEQILFSSKEGKSDFEVRNNIKFSLLDNYLRGIPCGISPEGVKMIEDSHNKNGLHIGEFAISYFNYSPVDSKTMTLY